MLPMNWLLAALAAAPLCVQATSIEGPLGNDSFQPTNLTAEELFVTGLAALESGSTAPQALESLRSALGAANPGEGLRLPGEAPARVVVGVESAVLWALEAANDKALVAWTARFDELARESAGSPADIERRFPATGAALLSAIRLADEAFEAGRHETALLYLDRAERHLALRRRAGAHPTSAISDAIARRRQVLSVFNPSTEPARLATTQTLPAAWEAATSIPRPRTIPFEFAPQDEDPYLADLIGNPVKHAINRSPSTGLRPGLVALTPTLVAVQTAAGLHLIDISRAERDRVVEPAKLVEPAFGRIGPSRAARKGGAPGWPHLPKAAGDNLLVVVGRTEPGRAPNALAAISIKSLQSAATSALDLEADQPSCHWILSGSRIFSADAFQDPALLAPLEGGEIQPGPAVFDDTVILQVRVLDGEVKTYLVALELATGAPRWIRLVTKGGDIGPVGGARFSTARLPLGSASPLCVRAGHVLVQSNLGVSSLYDAADGRLLWSFKNRRRAPAEPGWSGLAPLAQGDSTLAIAPADSDFAYLLQNRALAAGQRTPLAAAPLPLGSSTDLVAATKGALFTFNLAGGERQLSQLDLVPSLAPDRAPDLVQKKRVDSILLRTGEAFVGEPATGTNRILASSNRGLFLFDRTRELLLLDYLPIPGGAGPREAGGTAKFLGNRLLLLGPGTLWVFDLPE